MKSGIYWEVFESTGSIEAYLTFKTVDSSANKDEDGSVNNLFENRKTESVREKSTESVLITE